MKKITKAVIIAGGKGTRFIEETTLTPKPMINVGPIPIIQRIMNHYSNYGIKNFIICGGYKINVIKDYFLNFNNYHSDLSIDIKENEVRFHNSNNIDWKIEIINTGIETMTGGRIRRIKDFIGPKESFCLTYGDGISDINIAKLINFHFKCKKIATMTAVQPPARYGSVQIKNNKVIKFQEKPKGDNIYINGGFFVLNYEIFKFIKGDSSIFEKDVLPILVKKNNLSAYEHKGFWHAMDSLRDKISLDELYSKNKLNF